MFKEKDLNLSEAGSLELLSKDSAGLRSYLIGLYGSAIDRAEVGDTQEILFDDGMIISIELGLRAHKFGQDLAAKPIRIQVEQGSDAYEVAWEEASSGIKERILSRLLK